MGTGTRLETADVFFRVVCNGRQDLFTVFILRQSLRSYCSTPRYHKYSNHLLKGVDGDGKQRGIFYCPARHHALRRGSLTSAQSLQAPLPLSIEISPRLFLANMATINHGKLPLHQDRSRTSGLGSPKALAPRARAIAEFLSIEWNHLCRRHSKACI